MCNGDCPITKVPTSQGEAGEPINTRTGGYQYNIKDISIPTTAGELSFIRDYASLGVGFSTTLSPGWTHNQDTRLILPDAPDGKEGAILFKLHSSNLYPFYKNENGIYTASPELLATIVTYGWPTSQYVITDSNQNEYRFDENGILLSYSDPLNNSWDYSYNTSGFLERISANNGVSYLSFSYTSEGFLTSITDQTGRQVTYTYDNNGDLVTVTDILGQNWTYTYDSAHRMTNVLDPNSNSLERTEYDEQGRAVRQFDGKGNLVVALTYNKDGTTTIIDALGNQSIHEYDYRGTLINEKDATGSDNKKTFLSDFRPNKITDAEGYITDLRWSPDGANLIHIEDSDGNQTNITYDALNNPLAVVDPLNYLTTYEYSGKLLTSVTDALNKETTYTYTPEGYLQSTTDPLGKTTSYTNNVQGQRISMIDPSGNTWTYAYDEFGNLTSTTDPLGRISKNAYDNAGRLIISTQNYDERKPQNDENLWNIVTSYQYDARDNQIAVTDTYNRTTHSEYDAAGRLVKTIDPAGNETINTYNEAGQLVAVSDAMRHITQYAYDEAGRQISTTDTDGNIIQTIYNPDRPGTHPLLNHLGIKTLNSNELKITQFLFSQSWQNMILNDLGILVCGFGS